jgi:phage-related protein
MKSACEMSLARFGLNMYVAKFAEAVYVLHAFQKKTRKTARGDLELAKDRYQEVLMRRKSL